MESLTQQIATVKDARKAFIQEASDLTPSQSEFKPDPGVWSVKEIVEHMVWAEQGGVLGMWKAAAAMKAGKPIWEGENVNAGLTIKEVVERTWQPKELVPKVAEPRWGGPVEFWLALLDAMQYTLPQLEQELAGLDPETVIYPHPISGPLHVYQRIQFLRFHMQRHQQQIKNLKDHPDFP